MKGIVLAGGLGTRLHPLTISISKQIIPVYDKPMIYYPISVLMLAGIREILIISSADHIGLYMNLFGDGKNLGLSIEYKIQEEPRGIAEAFIIGEEFIDKSPVTLILGDNLFYGSDITYNLNEAFKNLDGATIFGYPVSNPAAFGVAEIDSESNVISITEKPNYSKSNLAIPGLYIYNNDVLNAVKSISPSSRGELEITDLNNYYLQNGRLNLIQFKRGIAWLDTGTPDSLLKASNFVESIQSNQGSYVACLEEIAWRRGFIDKTQLHELGTKLKNTSYGQYILTL